MSAGFQKKEKEKMERKKLILIGLPQVGKTSIIARWIKGIYSEKYLSTIGVKIDKKEMVIDGQELLLQIWDLAGSTDLSGPARCYIRGAHACLLVADGTRSDTLDAALQLKWQLRTSLGEIPFALAINKLDLFDSWQITQSRIEELKQSGLFIVLTSAKSGDGVELAFDSLARRAIADQSSKQQRVV